MDNGLLSYGLHADIRFSHKHTVSRRTHRYKCRIQIGRHMHTHTYSWHIYITLLLAPIEVSGRKLSLAFTLPPAAVIANYKLATFSCSLIKCMQFSFIPASLYKFIVYLPPPHKAKMLNISLAYLQWQNQKKKLRMVTVCV